MSRLPFQNRDQAAWELAEALQQYRRRHPLVLAVPRGAVPMGRIIADALGGDLDVVLVRKLPAPGNPELAIGAVDETGRVTLNDYASLAGASADYLQGAARDLRMGLAARRARYTGDPQPVDVRGRTVIVVDDGIATGATMEAALEMIRGRGPAHLVCATPVASPAALQRVARIADRVFCLWAPDPVDYVGAHYIDFAPVEDADVVAALHRPSPRFDHVAVVVPAGGVALAADVSSVRNARGLVIFVHASGSDSASHRHPVVASVLNRAGFSTLLLDLLTAPEAGDIGASFDIAALAKRVGCVIDWVAAQPGTAGLPVGLLGTGTGAAVALTVAAQYPQAVRAVVSRGGRPDLAQRAVLRHVRAPTLLMVGAADTHVLALNQDALDALSCIARLDTIARAGHRLEEPGALEAAAERAANWFGRFMAGQVDVAQPGPRAGAVAGDSGRDLLRNA